MQLVSLLVNAMLIFGGIDGRNAMKSLDNDIRFLTRTLPEVSIDEIRAVIVERYGFDGDYQSVRSERDQNFIVSAGDRLQYVVKISNAEEQIESIGLQVAALQHIASQDPSLPVPHVILDRDGRPYSEARYSNGNKHIVHVQSFIPGVPLNKLADGTSPQLRRRFGALVARLDLALRGFFHPAANQDHPWKFEGCAGLIPFTHHIADGTTRNSVDAVLTHASEQVIPRLQRLRHQVIHYDAHAGNVLAENGAVSGIIDFGDMMFGTLAAELSLACYSMKTATGDLTAGACDVVSAYDAVLPLDEAEIDCIFDLICLRHAMIVTIVSTRIAKAPGSDADTDAIARHAAELDAVLAIGISLFTRALRKSCRFPARCPTTPHDALDQDEEAALITARHNVLGSRTKHFYKKPLHFERASGVFLHGTDGKRYLDFYNNVPQVGHCHPHVVRAISRQAAALNTNTRYLYSSVIEYAERLTATLAPHLDACLFVNSGSEANDVAWQMARFATGGCGGLLMEDAYHGITDPIRHFSPGHPDTALPDYLQGLTVPDPYRNPIEDLAERCASDADRAIASLEESGHPVAAFMVDSAFCSSGVPDVPDGYLRGVEKRIRAAGGLMICDEVQSGFGRMGQWWGHEHHGVKADIVTMGKPAGNGHPLGIVVTSKALLDRFLEYTGFFSTFGGNTVACAAGNAVLDVIEREDLIENGRDVGDYLLDQLRKLGRSQPLIGNVRGYGLISGLEFVTDRDARTPATDETARLLELMRERQVLVGKEGRFGNVLKLRPALVLEKSQVDLFIAALDSALDQV